MLVVAAKFTKTTETKPHLFCNLPRFTRSASMKVLRRLLAYVRPIHHYLPEYIVFMVLGIVLGIVNFTMLIPMLNLLFGSTPLTLETLPPFEWSAQYAGRAFNYYVGKIALESGKMQALALVCAIIAAATVCSNLFRYMGTRVLVRLKMNLLQRLRNHLYAKVTDQSPAWFNRNRKGDILSTMTNDVQEIEVSVINSFQIFLRDPFVIVAYFFTLFLISAKLTLFTAIFFPIAGFFISTLSRKLKKKGYFSQEMLGRILQHTDETLSGIRIIQAFRAKQVFREKFSVINSGFTSNSKALFNQRELASPLSEIMGVVVIVVLVMYGGNLVIGGELSGSMFITYLALYSQILQPAKNISTAISNMQKGAVSAERIFAILDAPIEIVDETDATPEIHFGKSIEFRGVGFRYASDTVLSNINFTLQHGKNLALVGKSGSGKSTIADLMLRFYDPSAGEILLDGKDIRSLQLDALRSQIGFVNQDPVIFNDTVLNNITMGAAAPNLEAARKAAFNAHALDFIEQMEAGFETILGDRGSRLSGGQRQRIAIARALYANPPILILDEATSALDTESEKAVQEAIAELMKNRTVLVIAHRLSTVRNADEILVLHDGGIAERGTHNELMQQQGVYRRLQELQELS
jgi:subfamily B ATP-binding cassette protein MsbA